MFNDAIDILNSSVTDRGFAKFVAGNVHHVTAINGWEFPRVGTIKVNGNWRSKTPISSCSTWIHLHGY